MRLFKEQKHGMFPMIYFNKENCFDFDCKLDSWRRVCPLDPCIHYIKSYLIPSFYTSYNLFATLNTSYKLVHVWQCFFFLFLFSIFFCGRFFLKYNNTTGTTTFETVLYTEFINIEGRCTCQLWHHWSVYQKKQIN